MYDPKALAIAKGDYEVETRYGTAVVHAPRDIYAEDLSQAFNRAMVDKGDITVSDLVGRPIPEPAVA